MEGAERMLNLIETCWPDHCDKRPLPIEISGSHLYKQFIWILGSLADKYPQFNQQCDALVVRISELDWIPKERAQKIMVPAACYLSNRPPAIGGQAIGSIANWCKTVPKSDGKKMLKLIQEYERQHQISIIGHN